MSAPGQRCKIIFHGVNAGAFANGFEELLKAKADITVVPDEFTTDAERRAYASADVVVSFLFNRKLPRPEHLLLLQIPGAGFDSIEFDALPPSTVVCNCFEHEQAIAEYVLAALLVRQIPIFESDRLLRTGDWGYRGGPAATIHGELFGKTIGVVGFGHIGRAVAERARVFGMTVHVANRSRVEESSPVDRYFPLNDLKAFFGAVDFAVMTLPLTPETRGLVGQDAFAAMRPSTVVVNVGRGHVIDEKAFYDALKSKRIAGAVIDTWYNYPTAASPAVFPSVFPFHELPNVVMTPHMSGWTGGTVRRRQLVIAENIERRLNNQPCINVVHASRG